MKYYKILVDGKSFYNGNLQWSLPKKDGRKWIPGEWHTVDGNIAMCERGLHVTSKPYNWYKWGCDCYEAEIDFAIDTREDKIVCRKARLVRPVPHPQWWLDAIGFVESIKDVPFLKPDGKPLEEWKLFTAPTWDAARDAAGDAAWDAVRDAARDAAWAAARAAARAAAGAAAMAAARDAAWNAAGDAAWNAAGDAAWTAAGNAAWNAAWNAAGDAAWNAAGDASLYVQCVNTCDRTKLAEKHIAHAKARWQVWQKGYGLLCDTDGVLYVYAAVGGGNEIPT